MKKRVSIEVVCGLIIFTAGYFIGDATAMRRININISSPQTTTISDTKKDSTILESKNSQTKTYKIGEEGVSGNLNIKVLEVAETNTITAGISEENETTSEKFIVIKLQVKNISKVPIQCTHSEFTLKNIKDSSQYIINDNAFNAMQAANNKETIYNGNGNFVGVFQDINPNMSKQTFVVFEVPKNTSTSDVVLIDKNNNAMTTEFYLK